VALVVVGVLVPVQILKLQPRTVGEPPLPFTDQLGTQWGVDLLGPLNRFLEVFPCPAEEYADAVFPVPARLVGELA